MIGLATMVCMSHYTMLSKYGNCMRLSKLKSRRKSVVFANKVGRILNNYFVGIFNKTIIPLALVGYVMIIANSMLWASLAIYHLISNVHWWNNNNIIPQLFLNIDNVVMQL